MPYVVVLFIGDFRLARVGVARLPDGEFGPVPLPGDRCCVALSVGDGPDDPLPEIGFWLKPPRDGGDGPADPLRVG